MCKGPVRIITEVQTKDINFQLLACRRGFFPRVQQATILENKYCQESGGGESHKHFLEVSFDIQREAGRSN